MPFPASSLRDTILSVPGCVGLYMATEMGGTVARDETATNPGTYTGTPTFGRPSVTPGSQTPAVKYNGSGNYVSCKAGTILATLVNASVVCAIRTTLSGSNRAVYCERGSSGNDIWKFECSSNGTMRIIHRDDAGTLNQLAATTSNNNGRPHIVALAKTGTSVQFYRDGLKDGVVTLTGTDTFTNATNESRIGGDKGDGTATFPDDIGFVALFNRALIAGEVGRISVAALGL
jgi:hypothetical protein